MWPLFMTTDELVSMCLSSEAIFTAYVFPCFDCFYASLAK